MRQNETPLGGKSDVDYHHRDTVNLIAVIAIMLVGACLYWIFTTTDQRRKLELCVGAGRKDCFALPAQPGGVAQPGR